MRGNPDKPAMIFPEIWENSGIDHFNLGDILCDYYFGQGAPFTHLGDIDICLDTLKIKIYSEEDLERQGLHLFGWRG